MENVEPNCEQMSLDDYEKLSLKSDTVVYEKGQFLRRDAMIPKVNSFIPVFVVEDIKDEETIPKVTFSMTLLKIV